MEWVKNGVFIHGIKDGKLIIKVQNTGEEFTIPVSKDADKVTTVFWRKAGMEGLFHTAALKRWGDDYFRFFRTFYSQAAKQLAKEFMKSRGMKEGQATARTFFELALPQLELEGFFLLQEQKLEVVEMNDKRVHVRVWSCPLYAAWKKVGLSDEECYSLCKLQCLSSKDVNSDLENWDEAFAHVLNPKLQYRVYQCLPQGVEYCEIVQEITE